MTTPAVFLVEGRHGPVDAATGLRLAAEVRDYVAARMGDGTIRAAWAKAGGGRVMIVDAVDRAAVDRMLAATPGPADQHWEVTELTDLLDGLERYIAGAGA